MKAKLKIKLHQLHKKIKRGRIIVIRPMDKCNLECSFCSMSMLSGNLPMFDKHLTVKEWTNLIEKENKKEPIKMIRISGGEPCLYKDIVPLVNKLVELGYIVGMLTNMTIKREGFTNSYRFLMRATYHTGFVDDNKFIQALNHYKKQKVAVLVQEIMRFKNSVKRQLQLDATDEIPELNISPSGNYYKSCSDVQTKVNEI